MISDVDSDGTNLSRMRVSGRDTLLNPTADLDFLESSDALCKAHVMSQNRSNLKMLSKCAEEALVGGKDTISGQRGFFGTIFSLLGQAPMMSGGGEIIYTSSNGARIVTSLKKLLDRPNPSKKSSIDPTQDAETEFEALNIEQQSQVLEGLDNSKHRRAGKAMGIIGRVRMVIGLGSGGVSIMTSLLVAAGIISSAVMPFFIPIIFGSIGAALFLVPMITNAIRRFGSDKEMTKNAKGLYRRLDHTRTIDPKLKSGRDMMINVSEKKHKLQLANPVLYDQLAQASDHNQIYGVLLDCAKRCGKNIDEHTLAERADYLYKSFNPNSSREVIHSPLNAQNLRKGVVQPVTSNLPESAANMSRQKNHGRAIETRVTNSQMGSHVAAEMKRRSSFGRTTSKIVPG